MSNQFYSFEKGKNLLICHKKLKFLSFNISSFLSKTGVFDYLCVLPGGAIHLYQQVSNLDVKIFCNSLPIVMNISGSNSLRYLWKTHLNLRKHYLSTESYQILTNWHLKWPWKIGSIASWWGVVLADAMLLVVLPKLPINSLGPAL